METVGRLFVDDAGNVWRHVSYTTEPTAAFRCLEAGDEAGRFVPAGRFREAVARTFDEAGFRLLVPESE